MESWYPTHESKSDSWMGHPAVIFLGSTIDLNGKRTGIRNDGPNPNSTNSKAQRKRNGRLISISRLAAHFAFVRVALFRELGYVPAAAEGADKANTGNKLPSLEVDGGALIINQRGLGRKYLEIAGDTALVALIGEIEGILRRCDGTLFGG